MGGMSDTEDREPTGPHGPSYADWMAEIADLHAGPILHEEQLFTEKTDYMCSLCMSYLSKVITVGIDPLGQPVELIERYLCPGKECRAVFFHL